MGVANKTLPCGTLVTLRYDGRTVRVAVIDRGPYVAGREFDLTEATKQALGFGGVGRGVEHALIAPRGRRRAMPRRRADPQAAASLAARLHGTFMQGWLSVSRLLESAECLRE